jgi:hypothetical protein
MKEKLRKKSKPKKFFDLWSRSDADKFTSEIAVYCASRSGRFSNELLHLVKSEDFQDLCAYSIDYHPGDSVRDLRYARQCLSLFSKDADLRIGDPEAVAWGNFRSSEAINKYTNMAFHRVYESGKLFTCDQGIIFDVGRKITSILGDCPLLENLDIGFGPGANTTIRKITNARSKLDAPLVCSSDMQAFFEKEFANLCPMWSQANEKRPVTIGKGELSFVDKNALSKRSIIIEPILNTLFQKGVGREMKKLLLKAGCNLYDQTKNQRLARKGSIDGTVVTVDIKQASNSLATLVVFFLIQNPEWFYLLESFRTSEIVYRGENRTLEMFSSMGNGFTFELESLIFYAIALVVADRNGVSRADQSALVSVYGDDIIVPVNCYPDLIAALHLFGFEINTSKSFASGPFRESCGSDYFLGQNVRPFYKKDRWTYARVVGIINYDLRNFGLFSEEFRDLLISYIPDKLRLWGPDNQGDGHLVADPYHPFCYRRPPALTPKQLYKQGDRHGVFFDTFTKVPKQDDSECGIGDSLLPYYDIYVSHELMPVLDWAGNVTCYVDTPEVSREADPYVVRGGWCSRKTTIYLLFPI